MKKSITALASIFLFTMQTPKKVEKKYAVNFAITYTESYCMGMRPTEQILKELSTPKQYPNRELSIIKGNGNFNSMKSVFVGKILTDKNGFAKLNLQEGVYSIIDNEKAAFYSKVKNDTIDYKITSEACVQDWIKSPIFTFTVTKKGANVKYQFNKSCYLGENASQCISYIGPQRP